MKKFSPTKILLAVLFVFFNVTLGFSQVGIGTSSPDNSSILDVKSSTGGVLVPRMTTAERNRISSPATGLLIYDTTRQCLSQQVGTPASPDWVCISGNVVRFFYLPSLNIDTSETGNGEVNLYEEYKKQFSQPLVSSTPGSTIPYFESATDLDYHVTAYDSSVLDNLSLNQNGVLSYEVIGSATACSFINVVLVVK
ncbi:MULTISPECIES: hypothetical protein [Zunongwangia]|uniref:Hep_Hag family protein n=2 Tax=Zunongwangia TaxID=417127 RepID=A0A1Y1T7G3_9FLAO|nr:MULTISPECIES: hypothetical protein [Zunongwangia]ORL46999.1 Hep_Hag family protein [Zunongwangia atlantica 22II14-10F7]SFC29662.1 hypothetical protein SAMN04487907_103240 [Zunongwangia mangrovi]